MARFRAHRQQERADPGATELPSRSTADFLASRKPNTVSRRGRAGLRTDEQRSSTTEGRLRTRLRYRRFHSRHYIRNLGTGRCRSDPPLLCARCRGIQPGRPDPRRTGHGGRYAGDPGSVSRPSADRRKRRMVRGRGAWLLLVSSVIPGARRYLPITGTSSGPSAIPGYPSTTLPVSHSDPAAGTSRRAGPWLAKLPMPSPGRPPPASLLWSSAPATGALPRDELPGSGLSSTDWPCSPSFLI